MADEKLGRRTLMKGAVALATAGLSAPPSPAQQPAGPSGALPARSELLIRGATVLTMDPAAPDLAAGDVHVRDGSILAVAPRLDAPGAQILDGSGMILIPGFIDTHLHLWTSALRVLVRADLPEQDYFPVTARLGPLMQPEDNHRAVLLGLAEALAAGVTTVHNWAHNIRSPAHAHAELTAMRQIGLRGRFSYGPAVGMPADQPLDFAGLDEVEKHWLPDPQQLLTFGICSRNLGAVSVGGESGAASRGALTLAQLKRDWDGARARGLPITLHTSGPSPVKELERAGLLRSDVQLVHPLLNSPEDLTILKARGVSYSISPQLDARRAAHLGEIQLGELLAAGIKTSLSTDHTASISVDPFASMRLLFALHSHRLGDKMPLSFKRLLQLATLDGAVDLGLAAHTGSISPGKRADLVLVRTTDVNIAPAPLDPYEAIVSLAMPANVDTVIADGRVLRRASRFTAADHGAIVAQARESALRLRSQAGWPA